MCVRAIFFCLLFSESPQYEESLVSQSLWGKNKLNLKLIHLLLQRSLVLGFKLTKVRVRERNNPKTFIYFI